LADPGLAQRELDASALQPVGPGGDDIPYSCAIAALIADAAGDTAIRAQDHLALEGHRASRQGTLREGRAHRTAIDTEERIRSVDRGRPEAVAAAETGAEDKAAANHAAQVTHDASLAIHNRITSTLQYEIVVRPLCLKGRLPKWRAERRPETRAHMRVRERN
jgi:hypothetical protein